MSSSGRDLWHARQTGQHEMVYTEPECTWHPLDIPYVMTNKTQKQNQNLSHSTDFTSAIFQELVGTKDIAEKGACYVPPLLCGEYSLDSLSPLPPTPSQCWQCKVRGRHPLVWGKHCLQSQRTVPSCSCLLAG